MGLKAFLDSALSAFEKDHDDPSFTYKGESLSCIPSNESNSMPLQVDGFLIEIDLTLIVRKAVLPEKPIAGKKLTYNGKEYRIARVTEPAAGSHWEIAFKDANQG